jgi:serine phosphatase RsbU (regulator of sigma subunit)
VLRQVLEHLPVGVVVQRGPDLLYVYANAHAEALVGTGERLVGRTMLEVCPNTHGAAQALWRRALSGETVVEHGVPVHDPVSPDRDGAARAFDLTLIPILESGAVTGVLTLFTEETEDTARHAELRRLLAHEHETVTVLQRALLPRLLPDVPGWCFVAAYEPAVRAEMVGGDFYDVLTWRDHVLLVLGDVSGKGPHAATVTAEIRGALRALVVQDLELEEILRWVDRMLVQTGDDYCTLAIAVLPQYADGGGGPARVLLAGHPPVLCLRGAGGCTLVGTPTPPLGTGLPIEPAPDAVDVAVGDTLVLYSDGLLEAHAPQRLVDPSELPALLGAIGALELERAVVGMRSELVGQAGDGRDDLAILAARRVAVG